MTVTLQFETRDKVEFLDITAEVRRAVRQSGAISGLAALFVPHTTAAITINENADPDVIRDMEVSLNNLVPLRGDYRHMEGNSAAHIKSSLMGASSTLLIENGELLLGTWQGIYFCEFDGPRHRKLHLRIVTG